MARISFVPADISEPRDVVEAMRARRGGSLVQVDRLLLHSPRLAEGWNAWIGAVRSPQSLSPLHKELATCAVAVLTGSEFEMVRHAPVFLREGGTEAQLEALRAGIESAMVRDDLFDVAERAILGLALEITREIKVRQEVFDAATAALGTEAAMLELIAVIVTYNMTTRFIAALEVDTYGDPLPVAR